MCFNFHDEFSSVQSPSHPVMSESLWLHGLEHNRPPCPSTTPRVYSNSCPLSRWCNPTISPSVVPFSSCLLSYITHSKYFFQLSSLRLCYSFAPLSGSIKTADVPFWVRHILAAFNSYLPLGQVAYHWALGVAAVRRGVLRQMSLSLIPSSCSPLPTSSHPLQARNQSL